LFDRINIRKINLTSVMMRRKRRMKKIKINRLRQISSHSVTGRALKRGLLRMHRLLMIWLRISDKS
jgi:hypothetical protein